MSNGIDPASTPGQLPPDVRSADPTNTPEELPPLSTLVKAFEARDRMASDAVVLRGYLGRSDVVDGLLQFLEHERRVVERLLTGTSLLTAKQLPESAAAGRKRGRAKASGEEGLPTELLEVKAAELQSLREGIQTQFTPEKRENYLPWRLYLSPRLDRYVDFSWSQVLAWRPEHKDERRDAYTVWLRSRDPDSGSLYAYYVYQVTDLGQSTSSYLGGDVIDDYLAQPAAETVVWDEQQFGPTVARRTYVGCTG